MTKLKLTVTTENDFAVFCISDNGCGIPTDRLDKIFTGYLDRDQTPADGSRSNMGIGLSVCAAIIKAHGGEIHVRNNKFGGASFSFALKLES